MSSAYAVHTSGWEEQKIHSHAPSITRVHHLLRQVQKWLPSKRPTNIKYRCRAADIVAVLPFHLLQHALEALGVGNVSRYSHCCTALIVDGVDDGDVVVWIAGEENDGVSGGEFAGKSCAGLQELRLALMAEEGEWRG